MFAIPPDGNPQPPQEPPRVELSWTAYLFALCLREDSRARFLLWIQGRRIRRAVRDPNSPCPACGARPNWIARIFIAVLPRTLSRNYMTGEMKWSDSFTWGDGKAGALIVLCKICHAPRGVKPIVAFDQWKVTLTPLEERSIFDDLQRKVG